MSIEKNPELWLEEAVNAVNDFVINGLSEQDPQLSILEYSKIKNPADLAGSYIILNCTTYQIEVGLLIDAENIRRLTQKMLISDEAELSEEQISDALNEAINIIAGGIKSRLNEHVEGGITLGLPHFFANLKNEQKGTALLQYIAIGDLYVSISIRVEHIK